MGYGALCRPSETLRSSFKASVGGHSRPKSEEIRWAMSPLRSAFDVTKQIRVLPVNHGPGDHGRLALVVELHAGYAHLVSRIENNFVSGQECHGRQVDLNRTRNSFDYDMCAGRSQNRTLVIFHFDDCAAEGALLRRVIGWNVHA